MIDKRLIYTIIHFTFLSLMSCQKSSKVMGQSAEYYFDDDKVIELCHAIESNNKSIVRKLVKDGVKINTVGKEKSITPLLWAIWLQKPEMVTELIRGGVDVNKQANISKQTPSMEAAALMQFDIVLILLENGADPFIKDATGSDLSYEVELHYKLRSRESNQFKNLLKTIEILKGKGMKLNLVRKQE